MAIGVGSQVFVSTNALAATVGPPSGVTFANITRNLPSRNVARVAFDPNDPSMIYVVLGGFSGGGHVFRTSIGATAWTDISPALNVPFNAIALDGTDTPTAIYAGTDFGVIRSVDGGASWSVLDDIHFPRVPVFDLALRNGILRAATYGRGAFEFVRPQGPSIAVNLENDLEFGTVCQGGAAVSRAGDLQRRQERSGDHQRAAPNGIDRFLGPCHARDAGGDRGGRAPRFHGEV